MPRLKEIILENDTTASKIFNLSIQTLIIISLIALAIEMMPDLSEQTQQWLYYIEVFTVAVFTLEYLLRIWFAERKLAFIFSFYGLVDFLAILPFYISLGVDLRSTRIVRLLRLLRLLRALKLFRFSEGLSAKTRLVMMLLAFSFASILIIGYLGVSASREALSEAVFNQLSSMRSARANQIEAYFRNLRNQIQIYAEDETVIAAMVRFNKAYSKLEDALPSEAWEKAVGAYYQNEFFPRLSERVSGQPTLAFYRPEDETAYYLQYHYIQYHYIAANRHAVGEKQLLDDPEDGSEYSAFHQRYHPFFRDILTSDSV